MQRVAAKEMPPTKPLSHTDIAKITAWVNEGAKLPVTESMAAAVKTGPVSVQSAIPHPDVEALLTKLMTDRGMEIPPPPVSSICLTKGINGCQ